MPKPPTLDDLETQAADALRKASDARRAAETARLQDQERRDGRLEAFDRQRLSKWNGAALDADVDEARRRMDAALLADPTWQAVIDWQAAQNRRSHLWLEASGLSAQYGRGPFTHPPSTAELHFDLLVNIAQQAAAARVRQEMADRDTARQEAAQ